MSSRLNYRLVLTQADTCLHVGRVGSSVLIALETAPPPEAQNRLMDNRVPTRSERADFRPKAHLIEPRPGPPPSRRRAFRQRECARASMASPNPFAARIAAAHRGAGAEQTWPSYGVFHGFFDEPRFQKGDPKRRGAYLDCAPLRKFSFLPRQPLDWTSSPIKVMMEESSKLGEIPGSLACRSEPFTREDSSPNDFAACRWTPA